MSTPLPPPAGGPPPTERTDDRAVDPGRPVSEVARARSVHGELVLRRRAAAGAEHLELRANGVFVMDTLETSTERAMADASLAAVAQPRRVAVGGLGLGFTLQAVLADPRVRLVTVVELEEALVGWLRDGTVPHGPALLADERVRLVVGDVAHVDAWAGDPDSPAYDGGYDVVLLDVDNGPGYLVHDANAALYREPFLAALRRVLRPGGALVVWSAAEAPELGAALGAVFGAAEARPLDVALQGRAEQYWLYSARVPSRA